MYTLEEFKKSQKSLVVYHGDEQAFESAGADLAPLLEYLDKFEVGLPEVTVFDKYTGRAAALLMVLIKPSNVLTGIISDGGAKVFTENGLDFEAGEQVDFLMGVASKDMCRWEKMSIGKNPSELLTELRRKYGAGPFGN